jgi:hypothetical protein
MPQFPSFKSIELSDRDLLHSRIMAFRPETSEMNFSNFFMWRHYYRFEWTEIDACLAFLVQPLSQDPYLLMPLGPEPRFGTAERLLAWLREARDVARPCIQKADAGFAAEAATSGRFRITPQREHFDYVYASSELAALAGRKFHSKKNHINRFHARYASHEYRPIDPREVPECLRVLDHWCKLKGCGENPVLQAEADAIRAALSSYGDLELSGGVLLINGRVEAFTFGELLNPETLVVHVEKADPGIPELYSVINQKYSTEWNRVPWINREQDLGDEGLRRSKRSYQPVRLVEKFKVEPV